MKNLKENIILEIIGKHPDSSSKEIFDLSNGLIGYATVKRVLSQLSQNEKISIIGKGKNTKYRWSEHFNLFKDIDVVQYFEKEIDERNILQQFNFDIFRIFDQLHSIFSNDEISKLASLKSTFEKKILSLNKLQWAKEMERLAIDLSWKSSQIEGNTYSLLETEILLKEKHTASGKTKDEAIMLLNHKEAIDFVIENPDYFNLLNTSKIEDIHRILTKDLEINKNVRRHQVGISGTNYKPLDNEFLIKEALEKMCNTINLKSNPFEKAFLSVLLISYIQPFVDGNKRTSRIVSNSILLNYNLCPLSYRTVNSLEYKKAMLLFYEQNSIQAFKNIFIEQFAFAVNTYF